MNDRLSNLLDEKGAIEISRSVNAVLGIETLRRAWVQFPREYNDPAVKLLRAKGWAANGNIINDGEDSNIVVDPLVDGRPRKGIWVSTEVGSGIERQDPTNPQSAMVWAIVQTLVRGDAQFSGIVSENGCDFIVTISAFFGMSTLPVLPGHSNGIKYRLSGFQYSEQYGGWNFIIERRQRLPQTHTFKSEDNAFNSTKRLIQLGINPQTLTPITAPTGETKRRTVELLDDCMANAFTDTNTAKAIDEAVHGHVDTAFETRITTGKRSQDAMETDHVVADGKIIDTRSVLNEFEKWDVEQQERQAKPVEWEWVQSDDGVLKATRTSKRHQAEPPADALPGSGRTVDRLIKNDFDLWDWEELTVGLSSGSSLGSFAVYGLPERKINGIILQNEDVKVIAGFTDSGALKWAQGKQSEITAADLKIRAGGLQVANTTGWFRWKFDHALSVVDTRLQAISALAGEFHVSSGFVQLPGGRFIVDKVTATHEATGAPAGLPS